MISSLQNFLQKHHKPLFGTLLVVIIVSFVFALGSPGFGHSRAKHMYVYGKDLRNEKEISEIAKNIMFSSILHGFDMISWQRDVEFYVARRVIAYGMGVNDFGIQMPDEETLNNYVRSLSTFADDDGKFSYKKYSEVVELLKKLGCDDARLNQVICEDYVIDQVEDAIIGNGFVTDKRMSDLLKKHYDSYDISEVTVMNDKSTNDVQVTREEIEKEFNENHSAYMHPDMFTVSAIKFENSRYKDKIPDPSDDELKKFFEENRKNFPDKAVFFGVEKSVREEYLRQEMFKLSRKDAEDFVTELYEKNIKLNSDDFMDALKRRNVTKEHVDTYSKWKVPEVDGISQTYLSAACDLDGERYFTDPCPAMFGYVVLLQESKKDAREMTLEEANDEIKQKIERNKLLEMFSKKLESIRLRFLVEDCDDVCKSLNLKCKKVAGVSLSNMEEKGLAREYGSLLQAVEKKGDIDGHLISENEFKFFVVTNKKDCVLSDIPKDDIEKVKSSIIDNTRESFLMNFFVNHIISLFKK